MRYNNCVNFELLISVFASQSQNLKKCLLFLKKYSSNQGCKMNSEGDTKLHHYTDFNGTHLVQ